MKGEKRDGGMVVHVEDHEASALDRAAAAAIFLIALWSLMAVVLLSIIWFIGLLT